MYHKMLYKCPDYQMSVYVSALFSATFQLLYSIITVQKVPLSDYMIALLLNSEAAIPLCFGCVPLCSITIKEVVLQSIQLLKKLQSNQVH